MILIPTLRTETARAMQEGQLRLIAFAAEALLSENKLRGEGELTPAELALDKALALLRP